MRLLPSLTFIAILSFALPATADAIHDDDHQGDDNDGNFVVTDVEVHPSHDIHELLQNDQGEDENWDEDSNDEHDGFADSDVSDGPSNPTPQNGPVANDPPVTTPEPNAFLLLGTGIAMAVTFRRKRSRVAV